MRGDNFTEADISPAELDPIVALLRRLTYADWHAAEKVRMYEANPKRGLKISLDEKGS